MSTTHAAFHAPSPGPCLLLALALACLACNGNQAPRSATPAPVEPTPDQEGTTHDTPEAPLMPTAPTLLLLESRDSDANTLHLQALTLPDLEASGTPRTLPAPVLSRDGYPIPPPIAHDGHGAFVMAEAQDGEHFLASFSSLAATPVRIPVGALLPVALFLSGRTLFVGAFGEVGWIDLGAATPTYATLVARPDYPYKPYDLFAHSGAQVLAIDDIVMPIFADLFALDAQGQPGHVSGMELPGVINGTYTHAALTPGPAANQHTLYLLAPFSIMAGHGHIMGGLTLTEGRLDHDTRHPANSGAIGPFVQELVSRRDDSLDLVAGDIFTPWQGMSLAVSDAQVTLWVAAGERGLFRFDAPMNHLSRPAVHDLGAPCLDVIAHGAAVYALVGGDTPAVLRLDAGADTWQVAARTTLAAPASRFVR